MSEEQHIIYTVDTFASEGFEVRFKRPGKAAMWWNAEPFNDPGEASQEFKARFGQDCVYVELEEFKRLAYPVKL